VGLAVSPVLDIEFGNTMPSQQPPGLAIRKTYRQMVFMQFQGDSGDPTGENFVSIPEADVL
jgi:hypothetical protein